MELVFMKDGALYLLGLVDLICSTLFLICFIIGFSKVIRRTIPRLGVYVFSLVCFLATLFSLSTIKLFGVCFLTFYASVYTFVNLAEFRNRGANTYQNKKIKNNSSNIVTKHEVHTFNKMDLYKTINDAVVYLSKHKIGALLTFEKNDDLKTFLKNGSILNAPVTYELLITIFYPGTRLHDGAVIIKDDVVKAASVYFNPTTRPLLGKYGSRHRAALGISEVSDSITVVVSEETGKISIANNGELNVFNYETFYKAFVNIMSETSVVTEVNQVESRK